MPWSPICMAVSPAAPPHPDGDASRGVGILVGGTNLVSSVSAVSFGTNQLGQTSAPVAATRHQLGAWESRTRAPEWGHWQFLGIRGGRRGPMAYTVPPGGSTTFTVTFRPTRVKALATPRIYLWSNRSDKSPFFIGLTGLVGVAAGTQLLAERGQRGHVAVQADGKILVGGSFSTRGRGRANHRPAQCRRERGHRLQPGGEWLGRAWRCRPTARC